MLKAAMLFFYTAELRATQGIELEVD